MLFIWIALDGVARAEASAEVAAYLAAIFLAGGTDPALLRTTRKFMEIAVILGCAMFGIAVVPRVRRSRDTSGADPGRVVFLPGLILGDAAVAGADNNVPPLCFWLVALAPLVARCRS